MIILFILLIILIVGKFILYKKLKDIDGLGATTTNLSEGSKIISVFEEEPKRKKRRR